MLKTRIIPTILFKDIGIVKGIGFDSWRRVGSLLPAIKVYNTRQVDELIVVDITATEQGRDPDFEMIDEIADECFVPLTVGGGIKSIQHIQKLLNSGADKVSINSYAYERPEIISEGAMKFGSQCIVASIDFYKDESGKYYCHSISGKMKQKMNPVEWAIRMEALGAGEILLTSINRDGTMLGYEIELSMEICKHVKIPVIASGGCGSYAHMLEALQEAKVNAVAASSIFIFTEQTPLEAKKFLSVNGIATRN